MAGADGGRDKARLRDREGVLAWLFVFPTVAYLIALVVVPLVVGILFAFTGRHGFSIGRGGRFHGSFEFHDVRAVVSDPAFRRALVNTLIATIATAIATAILGTLLANLLNARVRGRWALRFVALMPWTTPVALSAVSWRWLLDPVRSPLGRVLRKAGLVHDHIDLLTHPNQALASVVALHVWRLTPLAAVIIAAGLRALPRDIEDATRIDGAGVWRRTWEVRIPIILPVITIAAVVVGSFVMTDLAVLNVLTGTGSGPAVQTLMSLAYARGVTGGDVGRGAAVSLFLLPLLLAAVVVFLRAARRIAFLSGERS